MRIPFRGRRARPFAVASAAALALACGLPSAAGALEFELVNQSGLAASEVYVTVVGTPGTFDVPGMTNDVPVALDTIPNQTLTIDTLVSGRIYVSYGAPVTNSVTLASQTRFDWAELTVIPSSSDVANLTAVDQFGIGMRLDTLDGSGDVLETVGAANSDTVFTALQQIPGGPQATVRDGGGAILRVISPSHTSAYPDLGDYVRSLSGQTITLHTAYFSSPFVTSVYSGTFGPDGTIALTGTTNPPNQAPTAITFDGGDLIADVEDGENTPNTLAGAMRRDVLAGFSTGLWGSVYGNDAIGFCTDAVTNAQGSWCPSGFNQPIFGAARASLSPFPTCEQYAAVINQYTDTYGNPYSDASKQVTVSLDQPGTGGDVATLRLTIQPDSGSAQPVVGGNPNCGAAEPVDPGPDPDPDPDPPGPGPGPGPAPAPSPDPGPGATPLPPAVGTTPTPAPGGSPQRPGTRPATVRLDLRRGPLPAAGPGRSAASAARAPAAASRSPPVTSGGSSAAGSSRPRAPPSRCGCT